MQFLDDEEKKILTTWLEENDEVVMVCYPKKKKTVVYPSVSDLIREQLNESGYMAICAPYYNSVLKRMEYLEQIARGERPEGRPLSLERDTARSLIQSGLSYEATLWMLKRVAEQLSMEPSTDYSFGTHNHFHIDLKHSQRIRSAVDREWQVQFDTTPPSPPRNWWKKDDWQPDIYYRREVQADPH